MKKNTYIFTNGLIDLAQPRLGSKVVFKTDEFFALADRIINPLPPIFKEGVFDSHGKWMDGWETRRKRKKGHDYLIVKLGKPGRIYKVDVDTSFFNGNQPMHVSLEACFTKDNIPSKKMKWNKILNNKKTKANSHHLFNIKSKTVFSHVKLNIFPDGGVARLRVYGSIDISKVEFNEKIINLTSVLNGASIIACNNEHFGKAENILAPGVGKNMGDGWETRRSRGKNFDWLILKCATAGKVKKIQIDTHHFKGNYPDTCTLQAALITKSRSPKAIVANSKKWKFLLSKVKLKAHKKHNFQNTLMKNTKINHVKINIFPDGGISRIRLFGDPK
jgi:allantoicase